MNIFVSSPKQKVNPDMWNAGWNSPHDTFPSYPISSPLSQSSTYSLDSGYSGMTHQPQISGNNVGHDHTMPSFSFNESDGYPANIQDFYDQQTPIASNYAQVFSQNQSIVPTNTITLDYTQAPVNPTNMPHPFLEIVEQPLQPFRFRYKSEMHGTHGSLMGVGTERTKKSFPSVALRNFDFGKATIRCSLYQVPSETKTVRSPHSHRLISRHNDVETDDGLPSCGHVREVSSDNNFTAIFDGMGIIHTAKRNIEDVLVEKMSAEREFETRRPISANELTAIKNEAKKQAKDMNLNQACLCFQAYFKNEADNTWVKIGEPAFSNIVNNLKSALYGGLRITRMSTFTSEAKGGQEVFMFVEKLCKNNIKVRFFEESDSVVTWEAFGSFNESDVHHQYGIVLKTPPYRDQAILSSVTVKVQLYRPKDGSTSEALEFRYRPNVTEGRKRRRDDSIDFIPTVVGSHESPTYDNSTSSSFGGSRQTHGTSRGYESKLGSSQHQSQHAADNEESMYNDVLHFIGTFSTSDLSFSPNDMQELCGQFSEEFSRFSDIQVGGDSKLQIDGAGGTMSSVRRSVPDTDFKMLNKLKMLIKLFKNNFDSDKLHEMMMVLIDSQADTDENILLDCIEHGTVEEIRDFVLILVKYKLMDVLKSVNDLDQNCFHLLILAGNTSLLKVFLSLGVDVNQADAYGQTPLHLAVVHNDQDSLKELLKSKKIKLDELNDEGFTPLHIAVGNNYFELVKLLIESGADVLKKSPVSGDNVLHIAVMQSEANMEMIAFLIGYDEELLHQKNNSGINPIQTASDCDKPESLRKYMASFYRESYTRVTVDSNDDDEAADAQQSSSDSESETDDKPNEPLFDDKCLKELCDIFDHDEKWKGMLMLMDIEGLTQELDNKQSPSRSLFEHLDKTKKSLKTILEVFDMMDEKRAVIVIDEMLVRKFNKL